MKYSYIRYDYRFTLIGSLSNHFITLRIETAEKRIYGVCISIQRLLLVSGITN